jgi:NAD(P)-dependent dehydrogenase (short-subunit alcohol dehydrogenase family)
MTGLFDLTGRTVVVTGGNGGIGLGMADALAAAGANVAVWGRNEEKNAAAVEQLERHERGALAVRCDVADEAQVEAAMAQTVDRFGAIHGCIANAGVGGAAPSYLEMTTEEWRRVLAVNLDGVFFTTRTALDNMAEHGEGGSIITVSSLAAIEGQARGEHYAATKGALLSMTRAMAVEFARHGVRANAVLPGWIETDMTDGMLESEPMQTKVLKRVPMRRWGQPADFGGIAVYLTSDASAYHTGDVFVVDGGYAIF